MKAALLATATALVILAGCHSSDTPTLTAPSIPRDASTVPISAPVESTTPPAATGSRQLGDTDNGATIHVVTGTTVLAVLDSLYWTFSPTSPPGILTPAGNPVPVTVAGCVPGEGCGTVTATYTATSAGTAIIAASRTSCGEARSCTGNEGRYSVTVVVNK
ncbi:MAG: hypothetical protein ACRDZ8_12550 [Acidimicrobiales bacterium]